VQHLRTGHTVADRAPGSRADLSLDEALWDRVRRLPEAARKLLEVVAVAGRPVSRVDACRAAEWPGEERQIRELQATCLLRGTRPGGQPALETYHDRVREAVVRRLEPEVLRQHHRRLAEVLQEDGDCDPEVLAVHFLAAGESARAGVYYAEAAEQAAQTLAFDRAGQLYRLALQWQAPSEQQARQLRTRLGKALVDAGRGAEAAQEYLTAAEGAAEAEALRLRREAALRLLSSGHIEDGLAVLRRVLTAFGLGIPKTPCRAFLSLLWRQLSLRLQLWLRLRGLGFRQRREEEVSPAALARLDVCQAAAIGLGMVDTFRGAYFQCRALLLALRAGEPARLAVALAVEGAYTSKAGSRGRDRGEKLLAEAERLARQVDQVYLLAMVRLGRGIAACLAGSWREGQELCDQAEATFRKKCTGVMWELSTAHRFALWSLAFMGELAEIGRRLPGWIEEAEERGDLYGETNLKLVVRTLLLLAADEPARAREEVRRVRGRWPEQGFYVQHRNCLYDETQIDLYEGNGLAAWERLARHWPLLERSMIFWVQQVRIFQRHVRARAALSAAAQAGDREPLLRAAARDAEALGREPVAWAQALAQLVRAGVAASRGDGAGAAGWLRDAAARCHEAGLGLYEAAARRRLGQLLDGEEARRLVAQADAWMAGQKVVCPERMTALLVPGFGPPRL
jgi:hypothetical protein